MNVVRLIDNGGAVKSAPPPHRGEPGWQGKWFGIVPGKAFQDKRLTDGAVRCLGLMAAMGRANYDKGPERVCSTAQTTIARKMGKPRQSVNRWVKKLKDCGYLEKIGQTRLPTGGLGANVYLIVGYQVIQELNGPETVEQMKP